MNKDLENLWDDCNIDNVTNSINNHFINFKTALPHHTFSYYIKLYGFNNVQGFGIVPTLDEMILKGNKRAIEMDFKAFRNAIKWCINMNNIMSNY